MSAPASKAWIATGIGALVLVALAYALRPLPTGVDVAPVTRGVMTVRIEEEGRTRVRQVYTVSAPIAGRVLRSALDVGDEVKKGDTVVAVIQPADPPFLDLRSRHEIEAQVAAATAAVDLALAELRQAEGEAEFADADLVRNERLARSGTVPERTLQKAQLEATTRRAAVVRAKAQVDLRRRQLESERARLIGPETPSDHTEPAASCCVSVKAPSSGRILKRIHESEKVVAAGSALLEIGDTADMEIVVELLSTDAVKVPAEAKVAVTGWGGARTLAARVRRIEPGGFTKVSALGIEEQRVRAIVDFDGGDTGGLGHDYRVFVAIETWRAEKALRIPLSAIFRHGDGWAAYAVRSGRAIRIPLTIGQRNAEMAEVLSGLGEGESVVLHPSDRIADRTRVAPR